MNKHLVAVYGSLLSDLHNHHFMKNSKYIGEGTVRGTLYSLGSFPGLKLEGNTNISIEVYEVDDSTSAWTFTASLGTAPIAGIDPLGP